MCRVRGVVRQIKARAQIVTGDITVATITTISHCLDSSFHLSAHNGWFVIRAPQIFCVHAPLRWMQAKKDHDVLLLATEIPVGLTPYKSNRFTVNSHSHSLCALIMEFVFKCFVVGRF
jgi:hypothetical protein